MDSIEQQYARNAILALPAGHTLDEMVTYAIGHAFRCRFSTEITDAFIVVDSVAKKHGMAFTLNRFAHGWHCYFGYMIYENIATADTAPLAICRAALLAVQIYKDEPAPILRRRYF